MTAVNDLIELCEKIDDKEISQTFRDAINELSLYRTCGSVEECISRKEWMSFSIDDIRKKYIEFVRMMRQEMELDKNYKRKRRK